MRENKFNNTMERVVSHSLKGLMSRSGTPLFLTGARRVCKIWIRNAFYAARV